MNRRTLLHPGARRTRRGGFVLLMVVSVLGVCAILSFALLSEAALQVQAARNGVMAARADALAESGVEMASLYLQYPWKAPTSIGVGSYWTGTSNYSFGSSVPGTVSISVSSSGVNGYDVTSTATVTSGTATVTRKATAKLSVNPGLQARHAMFFNAAGVTTLGSQTTINGDIQALGTLISTAKTNGTMFGLSVSLGTGGTGVPGILAPVNREVCPSWSNLKSYSTYTYKGQTYSATTLSDPLASSTTLGTSPTNPAGIYIRNGDLTIGSNTTINGTLIVKGTLSAAGGRNTITAQDGFPALIVKNDLVMKGSGTIRDGTFNGLVWVGGSIKSTGLVYSQPFNIFGALMFGGSGTVDALYAGKVVVTNDPSKVNCPDLDTSAPTQGVKVVSWKQ